MRIILVILILLTFYFLFDGYYRKHQIEEFENNLFMDNPINKKQKELINKIDGIKNNYQPNYDSIADKLYKKLDLEPDSLRTINFENEQNEQNKRIKEITDYLTEIKGFSDTHKINPMGFKSIKSLRNGQPLNLIPIFDTNQDVIGYQLIVNGKCLAHTSIGLTNVVPCNQSDINQYFELKDIYSRRDYNSNIETGHIQPDEIDNNKYPFVLTKSVSNGNCLTNQDGFLSLEVCRPDKNQQWTSSLEHVNCLET